MPASVRNPEDGGNRTFYVYKDQQAAGFLGSSDLVQTSARMVNAWNPGTGTVTLQNQAFHYSYNVQANLLQTIDPVGRTTQYEYDSTGIDLRFTRQNGNRLSNRYNILRADFRS